MVGSVSIPPSVVRFDLGRVLRCPTRATARASIAPILQVEAFRTLGMRAPVLNAASVVKAFRRRAVRAHPDKNPDDTEKARIAFGALQDAKNRIVAFLNSLPPT